MVFYIPNSVVFYCFKPLNLYNIDAFHDLYFSNMFLIVYMLYDVNVYLSMYLNL